ncbi:hypothetical protein R5R35_002584 [Gryllus longicercus]|uniref:Ionotropic receptor n=1 Tax=Gryllus longicercus TaxID=2509291 RepID=A0AAN9ZBQ8_9ORTH
MKVHILGVLRCHLVEITRKLGFTLQFQPIANAMEGNEDLAIYKQLLHQLAVGDLDFLPDIVYGFISQLSTLDIIPSTEDDSFIYALVPFASPLPTWSLPLRVFSPRIWLALLGAAVAYALAWRVVAGESLAASAAAALRAFSSCGGAPQDRVRATPQRLQLAAALLASAVVVAATYQGRLYNLIVQPDHYPEIDTFEHLASSGIPLFLPYGFGKYFLHRVVKKNKILQNLDIRYTNTSLEWWLEMKNKRTAHSFGSTFWTMFAIQNKVLSHSRPMDEKLSSVPHHSCARRNWPWTEAVIALNLRLVQGGLMKKWRDDFNRSFGLAVRNQMPYLIYEDDPDDWSGDGPRPLSVADVLPHLQLLVSCLCAAAVTFCAERWRVHSGAQRFAQLRMRMRGNVPLCERHWRCKTDAHRPSKFMKLFSTKCTRK